MDTATGKTTLDLDHGKMSYHGQLPALTWSSYTPRSSTALATSMNGGMRGTVQPSLAQAFSLILPEAAMLLRRCTPQPRYLMWEARC